MSKLIMLNSHDVETQDTTLDIKHGFCGLVCAFPERRDHSVYGNRIRGWYLYTQSNTGHIREICVVVNAALIGPHLDHLCPAVTHYSAMSWLCSPSAQELLKKELGDVGVRGFWKRRECVPVLVSACILFVCFWKVCLDEKSTSPASL